MATMEQELKAMTYGEMALAVEMLKAEVERRGTLTPTGRANLNAAACSLRFLGGPSVGERPLTLPNEAAHVIGLMRPARSIEDLQMLLAAALSILMQLAHAVPHAGDYVEPLQALKDNIAWRG